MRLTPQTPEGEILRAQAVLDAQTATWTNNTWASKLSNTIRKGLNDISGDLRAGDYLLPFIKTPANVIATGMDYGGVGAIKAIKKTVKAIKTGEIGSREYLSSVTKDLVRTGVGLVGAALIAGSLDDDDFVGAYDPARHQIEQLRNSNYNAIKIGDKWISTAWLGPLAISVTAMMYARKYGDTKSEKVFQYGKGIISQFKDIPGVSDILDYTKGLAYQQNQTLEDMVGSTRDYILEQAYSRLVPSLLSDIAKATDKVERVTGGTTLGTIINKIPGLRQTLPERKNIFGETVTGEPAWSDIAFGSRLKTDKETAIIKEINNVSTTVGKGINFTDWDKSSSVTLAQFKEKMGKIIYDEAKIKYGQELKKLLDEAVGNSGYQKLSNEEKYKVINGLDLEAMNKIYAEYNFDYEGGGGLLDVANVKKFQNMDEDQREFLIRNYSEDNKKKLRNPDIIFQDKLYSLSGPFSTKTKEESDATKAELKQYLNEFGIDYAKARELFLKEAKEQNLQQKTINERLQRLEEIYK